MKLSQILKKCVLCITCVKTSVLIVGSCDLQSDKNVSNFQLSDDQSEGFSLSDNAGTYFSKLFLLHCPTETEQTAQHIVLHALEIWICIIIHSDLWMLLQMLMFSVINTFDP